MPIDKQRAFELTNLFVMVGNWETPWSHLVAQLIEPLDLAKQIGHNVEVFCREAQSGLRAEWPESYNNKDLWRARTGPWCRQSGILRIIEIVRKTALRMAQPVPIVRSITPQSDLGLAENIVREFVKLSHNTLWEKMVSNARLQPCGCLIDALGIDCPPNRRNEVAFYAANALRRGRFQSLARSRAEWERKIWTDEEFTAVVQIVENAVRECLERPEPQLKASRPNFMLQSRSPGEIGTFVPWRHFSDRTPVAEAEGVYIFAYFESVSEYCVDPTGEEVIYIGQTEGQTLRKRLQQFEDTALGGSGHSGGWSYRIDFFPDDWEKVQSFHNTYVSWIIVPNVGPETPMQLEYRLKNIEYPRRWGRLPVLNKV